MDVVIYYGGQQPPRHELADAGVLPGVGLGLVALGMLAFRR
jgi:hypothetical protein